MRGVRRPGVGGWKETGALKSGIMAQQSKNARGREPADAPDEDRVQTVVVAGLGLLGGSLAGALRRRLGRRVRVIGLARRPVSIERALASGLIDAGGVEAAEWLPQADLTVLCVPLEASIALGRDWAGLFRPGAVVTDVGSVKSPVVAALRPVLRERGVAFVGSHPMAGSEQSGLDHADPELFAGAFAFVTPIDGDDSRATAAVEWLWTSVGARVVCLDPDQHDRLTAGTSHCLHLVAPALVQALLQDGEVERAAAAGAFRDMTRVAASPPSMWTEIVRFNRRNVLDALRRVRAELDALATLVEGEDWDGLHRYLQRNGARRREWERWRTPPNSRE